MEDTKKKPSPLATVDENPQSGSLKDAPEAETRSSGEKDGASASGSTSSEELLLIDESVNAAKPPRTGASSPFRTAKLPPRAPVCPGDPDVEGVLPSQPSIIGRMEQRNVPYVDPKDARQLLPGALLDSRSLDLDEVLDGMEAQNAKRAQEKIQEELLKELLRQKELENLYLAQQRQQQQQQQELLLAASASGLNLELLTNVLNEQCRVSPPGFPRQQFQPQAEVPSNNLVQPQMVPPKPHHRRGKLWQSDPTFAFADQLSSMPSPFQQTGPMDPAATTPLVDRSDALAFYNLPSLQQPDWTAQDLQQSSLQPNLGGLFSMPNTMNPEMPKPDTTPQRRRKHGHSKSVDFQNKARNGGSLSKDRTLPLAPATGTKSTTRAEVKKMVQQQAALGRPTYAPWFRDRANRNNREAEASAEMQPSHHRSQSMPFACTTPGSPEKKTEPSQPASKGGKPGTGVFLPRMPVSNS